MYFLDSNTCIDFLRRPNSSVRAHLAELPLADIQIPAVVKGELLNGAYKSRFPGALSETEQFLSYFSIVPFIDGMTYTYANIRSGLEKKGKPYSSTTKAENVEIIFAAQRTEITKFATEL